MRLGTPENSAIQKLSIIIIIIPDCYHYCSHEFYLKITGNQDLPDFIRGGSMRLACRIEMATCRHTTWKQEEEKAASINTESSAKCNSLLTSDITMLLQSSNEYQLKIPKCNLKCVGERSFHFISGICCLPLCCSLWKLHSVYKVEL